MAWRVLIAHAPGEEHFAEQLANPLTAAGYEVVHRATVLVGDSLVQEASNVLALGGPVVVAASVRAIGTAWARKLLRAAQAHNTRAYTLQMEQEADVTALAFGDRTLPYWEDPARAVGELVLALKRDFPVTATKPAFPTSPQLEARYRELMLASWDILDLANLPETEHHLATRHLQLRQIYVPLRVKVELGVDTLVGPDLLSQLESRRERERSRVNDRARAPLPESTASFGDRLLEARRLVVLGDPGAGKSTLLRWAATAYLLRLKQDPELPSLPGLSTLPDRDFLPILVRCRDLDGASAIETLDDILELVLRKAELGQDAEPLRQLLREKLRTGEALLLIDGLDEIADPTVRDRFCRQVERIQIAYPEASIVITSRIFGYRELGQRIGRGFEHVTLAELSQQEKDDFARRWCLLVEPRDSAAAAAEELIRDIHSADRIERLTGNPMLLTTLALVRRKLGRLPSRRADFFGEAIDVLLRWRSASDIPVDHREAKPQLEYLAYAMCDRGVQQLREDEVIELFARARDEYPQLHALRTRSPEDFLRLIERRTGLLAAVGNIRYQGVSVPVYEFRHLTFQEYLAGLAVVHRHFPGGSAASTVAADMASLAGRTREAETSHEDADEESELPAPEIRPDETWREPIRLGVASSNDVQVGDLLSAMLAPAPGEVIETTSRTRAIVVASCLADDLSVTEDFAESILQSLISAVSTADGNRQRGTALDVAVEELATSRWAPRLQELLLDEFCHRAAEDRERYGALCGALIATAAAHSEGGISAWTQAARSTMTGSDERAAVACALGAMYLTFSNRAVYLDNIAACLVAMLRWSAPAAEAAAWALWWSSNFHWLQIGPDELRRMLASVSPSRTEPVTLRLAAQLFGMEHFGASLGYLKRCLHHSDPQVRRDAATALGALGNRSAVRPLRRLLDDDEDVSVAAAFSLARLQDRRVAPLLIKLLDHSHHSVREGAANALGQLGDRRAITKLLTKLNDPTPRVRSRVAEALGDLADPQAATALLGSLNDPDGFVRMQAVEALGKLGDLQAVDALLDQLEKGNGRESNIPDALARLGDKRAVEPLLRQLRSSTPWAQARIIEALGKLGDGRAVEPLIQYLNDETGKWRRDAVIRSLGNLRDARAVEPLVALLSDEGCRDEVAWALGKIGDRRAREPLLASLSDGEPDTRFWPAAAWALRRLDATGVYECLLAPLRSEDQRARVAAVSALGELGDPRAIDPLLNLLRTDPSLDRTAALALGQLKDPRATAALSDELTAPDIARRQAALGGLAVVCDDEPDRQLLLRNFASGGDPRRDPADPVTPALARRAALELRLQLSVVRRRYEALSQRFGIRLGWKSAEPL
jgi:HEAT repeat protein